MNPNAILFSELADKRGKRIGYVRSYGYKRTGNDHSGKQIALIQLADKTENILKRILKFFLVFGLHVVSKFRAGVTLEN